MQIRNYIRSLILALFTFTVGHAFGIITVDSVVATESHCSNNGTITIYAHGPSTLLYALVSGPDIRPQQSGRQFSALPQGVYSIMITDFSNDTAIATATVTGSYVFPDFAPTGLDPYCPYSATGTVIGNPNTGSGRSPYTWVLTQISTGAVTTQSSDTFYNLYAGDYSVRMYDSCQSYATRFITLVDPTTSFGSAYVYDNMIACDTVQISVTLYPTNHHWAVPFYVAIYTAHGTQYDTLNPALGPNDLFYILNEKVAGVTYGDYANVSITNACGEMLNINNQIEQFDITVQYNQVTDSCRVKFQPYFNETNSPNPHTTFPVPLILQIWDDLTGVRIDSTTFTTASSYYMPSYFLEGGHSYHMTLTDKCGHSVTKHFTTPVVAPISVTMYPGYETCKDSTTTVQLSCFNFTSMPKIVIVSGPPVMHSTKPYFSYTDYVTYPDTFITPICASYQSNSICFGIGGLGIGTYVYKAFDTCGNAITDSFKIQPQDVLDFRYDHSTIKGCPGQNQIRYSITHGSTLTGTNSLMQVRNIATPAIIDTSFRSIDTIRNLNSGTYALQYSPSPYISFALLNPSLSCPYLYDTIIVPPYQLPRIDYAVQIKCNGTVNVGLLPDSSTGVPPYKYEIVAGPQTASVQASNFFQLTQPGFYQARISDTCGFARTFSFSVDTLSFQQIVQIGSSCAGSSVILASQHSPYATYVWQQPNGGIYIGDTLRLSPVNGTDYGTYHVTKIVHVNACSDTFRVNFVLDSNAHTYLYDTVCAGTAFAFGGRSYTVSGTYYDTLPTTTCDSIVELRLYVRQPLRDTISVNLCGGRPVTIGTHTYTAAGYYSDTIHTSLCDSIVTYAVIARPTLTSSQSISICTNKNFAVGSIQHYVTDTVTHIFTDTITSSLGCDSIVTSTVHGRPSYYGPDTIYLCTGDSIRLVQNWPRLGTKDTVTITASTFVVTLLDTTVTGCDSLVTTLVIFGNKQVKNIYDTICPGQPYTYHGQTITGAGTYSDTVPRAIGCDSITILHLSVRTAITNTINRSICTGQSVQIGTHTYSTTGTYTDTLSTASGCDSIIILHLSSGLYIRDTVSTAICAGMSLTIGTKTYSTAGYYADTFATASCDSIRVLHLSILNSKRDTISQTICTGQTVIVGSKTYSTTGQYIDTFSTTGCDSIRVLNLTVTNAKRDTIAQTICAGQSLIVGSKVYNVSGAYLDTFGTVGCDSIRLLNLTVSSAKRDTVSSSICAGGSITIGGKVYTTPGQYADTFSTAGCDSIRVLNLGLSAPKTDTIAVGFCRGDSITINGRTYSQPGVYYDTIHTTACDSLVRVQVTSYARPAFTIESSTEVIVSGDTVLLSAVSGGGLTYQWTSSIPLSDATGQTTIASPTVPGWVIAEARDGNNCTSTDSIYLDIKDCEGLLFVPNAFTPNGDGINDIYRLYGRCVELESFRIFNRWGELVYQGSDINEGWDGRYRGAMQPPEVYVYLISYFRNGAHIATQLKGSVTLIR